MILRAARDLEIDLSESFMIGDRYLDVRAADAAGVAIGSGAHAATARKSRSMRELPVPQPNFVADNLLHAVEAILSGQVK